MVKKARKVKYEIFYDSGRLFGSFSFKGAEQHLKRRGFRKYIRFKVKNPIWVWLRKRDNRTAVIVQITKRNLQHQKGK